MEIFKIADYIKKVNPEPDQRLTIQLLEKKAESMVGMFIVLPPGGQTPYHFHDKRESILIVISGKAKEMVEGRKIPIESNDILFIPAKQKHGVLNDSGQEFRFIEFQVGKPDEPDRVEVEWRES
ncbi:MAG: cupin domain-containing protein [Chloroflexi bacterium]|nr:cupin domain-containing protein [Chloroflexota bacterium]